MSVNINQSETSNWQQMLRRKMTQIQRKFMGFETKQAQTTTNQNVAQANSETQVIQTQNQTDKKYEQQQKAAIVNNQLNLAALKEQLTTLRSQIGTIKETVEQSSTNKHQGSQDNNVSVNSIANKPQLKQCPTQTQCSTNNVASNTLHQQLTRLNQMIVELSNQLTQQQMANKALKQSFSSQNSQNNLLKAQKQAQYQTIIHQNQQQLKQAKANLHKEKSVVSYLMEANVEAGRKLIQKENEASQRQSVLRQQLSNVHNESQQLRERLSDIESKLISQGQNNEHNKTIYQKDSQKLRKQNQQLWALLSENKSSTSEQISKLNLEIANLKSELVRAKQSQPLPVTIYETQNEAMKMELEMYRHKCRQLMREKVVWEKIVVGQIPNEANESEQFGIQEVNNNPPNSGIFSQHSTYYVNLPQREQESYHQIDHSSINRGEIHQKVAVQHNNVTNILGVSISTQKIPSTKKVGENTLQDSPQGKAKTTVFEFDYSKEMVAGISLR